MADDGYELLVYGPGEAIPADLEALAGEYLADSRRALASGERSFILACARANERSLGFVLLDVAPLGSGPLGRERIAYLERTFVLAEQRRRGIAGQLLKRAIAAAKGAGCWYIRCSNNWDNPAERALFLRCGFVLVDNTDEEAGPEPCYQAIRNLR